VPEPVSPDRHGSSQKLQGGTGNAHRIRCTAKAGFPTQPIYAAFSRAECAVGQMLFQKALIHACG